jgi:hypothetical protein
MLRARIAAAAAVAIMSVMPLLSAGPALAQDLRDFDIVNTSDVAAGGVYVSPSSADTWGPNILSDDVGPGDTLHVYFSDDLDTCDYDLYISYADGTRNQLSSLNLCATFRVVIHDTGITAE